MTKKTDAINGIRGYRLSEALEKKGMSQAELLRQAKGNTKQFFDMSPPRLNMILKGARPLRYEDAVVFADILGVDVDWLMGDPGAEMRFISEAEKKAKKYKCLLNQIGSNIVAFITSSEADGVMDITGYTVSYNLKPYDPENAFNKMDSISDNIDDTSEIKGIVMPGNFDAVNIPIEEMEKFYQDVCAFIKKRLDVLIALHEEEA